MSNVDNVYTDILKYYPNNNDYKNNDTNTVENKHHKHYYLDNTLLVYSILSLILFVSLCLCCKSCGILSSNSNSNSNSNSRMLITNIENARENHLYIENLQNVEERNLDQEHDKNDSSSDNSEDLPTYNEVCKDSLSISIICNN